MVVRHDRRYLAIRTNLNRRQQRVELGDVLFVIVEDGLPSEQLGLARSAQINHGISTLREEPIYGFVVRFESVRPVTLSTFGCGRRRLQEVEE